MTIPSPRLLHPLPLPPRLSLVILTHLATAPYSQCVYVYVFSIDKGFCETEISCLLRAVLLKCICNNYRDLLPVYK